MKWDSNFYTIAWITSKKLLNGFFVWDLCFWPISATSCLIRFNFYFRCIQINNIIALLYKYSTFGYSDQRWIKLQLLKNRVYAGPCHTIAGRRNDGYCSAATTGCVTRNRDMKVCGRPIFRPTCFCPPVFVQSISSNPNLT